MTPQINISQSLFEKIKGLAEPFVDTPESVITRCVEHYEKSQGAAKDILIPAPGVNGPTMIFPPDAPPDLTFTRILSVKLKGVLQQKGNLYWNALMYDVINHAGFLLKSPEKLKQLILVNYVDGEGRAKQGYRFLQAAGLSVQGQDANSAWRATYHIAKALEMSLDIVFMWENKDKALHPGKTGQMTFDKI
jgi:hypothetical protein